MSKESIMVGIIGLLAGVILAGTTAIIAVNSDNHSMMDMMGMDSEYHHREEAKSHGDMSMNQMSEELEDLSGDDFDKAFIEMMIAHHEGAVDMAELIPSRAKHDEIKTLGKAIISAQTKEISDMKQWQEDWNYSSDEMMHMMHGNY